MVMTESTDVPWQKVGTDLFSWSGKDYMVTTDYHSGFFTLDYLPDTGKLKNDFSQPCASDASSPTDNYIL